MDDDKLYRIARDAAGKAYAPYSGFNVGAALLTDDGTVFTGANVENASYGATICAERVAMSKAVSEGYRGFSKIAVAGPAEGLLPCGICRQFMFEFNEDLEIITENGSGGLQKYNLSGLLSKGFKLGSR